MEAFNVIKDKDFSQIPIYDEGRFTALLTTNTIARWVAGDLSDNQDRKSTRLNSSHVH